GPPVEPADVPAGVVAPAAAVDGAVVAPLDAGLSSPQATSAQQRIDRAANDTRYERISQPYAPGQPHERVVTSGRRHPRCADLPGVSWLHRSFSQSTTTLPSRRPSRAICARATTSGIAWCGRLRGRRR